MLAYKSALSVQRKLYMSNDFKTTHKNTCKMIREVAFKSKKWVELRTIEDYRDPVKKHKKEPAKVAHLKVAGEILEDVPGGKIKVYTSMEFLSFIQKLDNAKVQDSR